MQLIHVHIEAIKEMLARAMNKYFQISNNLKQLYHRYQRIKLLYTLLCGS